KKFCRTSVDSISKPMPHRAFAWSGHKRWPAVRATAIFDSRGSNCSRTRLVSALGQKQTFAPQKVMSALPPKADMCSAPSDVRFGPKADIALLDHLIGTSK